EEGAAATAKPRTKARAIATLLPDILSFTREGCAEPHINAIPKRRGHSTKMYYPAIRYDLPSVLRERQSVRAVRHGRLPDVVVPLPQAARRSCRGIDDPNWPEACLGANFVLQYKAQSDLGRSTVRFATKKLSRHPTSPLVARHAKCVAASFLRPDQETGDAKRHRQVVQPDKGLWVHQADGRRQGRICPYLGGRACRTLHPQRKSGC